MSDKLCHRIHTVQTPTPLYLVLCLLGETGFLRSVLGHCWRLVGESVVITSIWIKTESVLWAVMCPEEALNFSLMVDVFEVLVELWKRPKSASEESNGPVRTIDGLIVRCNFAVMNGECTVWISKHTKQANCNPPKRFFAAVWLVTWFRVDRETVIWQKQSFSKKNLLKMFRKA